MPLQWPLVGSTFAAKQHCRCSVFNVEFVLRQSVQCQSLDTPLVKSLLVYRCNAVHTQCCQETCLGCRGSCCQPSRFVGYLALDDTQVASLWWVGTWQLGKHTHIRSFRWLFTQKATLEVKYCHQILLVVYCHQAVAASYRSCCKQ